MSRVLAVNMGLPRPTPPYPTPPITSDLVMQQIVSKVIPGHWTLNQLHVMDVRLSSKLYRIHIIFWSKSFQSPDDFGADKVIAVIVAASFMFITSLLSSSSWYIVPSLESCTHIHALVMKRQAEASPWCTQMQERALLTAL